MDLWDETRAYLNEHEVAAASCACGWVADAGTKYERESAARQHYVDVLLVVMARAGAVLEGAHLT